MSNPHYELEKQMDQATAKDGLIRLKLICKECDWHGLRSEVLRAPNPFSPDEEVLGCPKCRGVDTFTCACDELGCWQPVSCGWPSEKGYRQTCSKHYFKHNPPKAKG